MGIVTDRDIVVRAVARGKDTRGKPASEVSRATLSLLVLMMISRTCSTHGGYEVRRGAVTAEDDCLVAWFRGRTALHGKDKDTGQPVEGTSTTAARRRRSSSSRSSIGERGARRRLAHLTRGLTDSDGMSLLTGADDPWRGRTSPRR